MASNHFSDVISQVQQSPQNQRTEKLIDGAVQGHKRHFASQKNSEPFRRLR
jgi:hypothetical protein